MTRFLTIAGLAAAMAAAGPPADAAATGAQCGKRDAVVERLAEAYGETRKGFGLAANETLMEVFASDETGSWTITVTMPEGLTCMIASGQHFEAVRDELPARGIKS